MNRNLKRILIGIGILVIGHFAIVFLKFGWYSYNRADDQFDKYLYLFSDSAKQSLSDVFLGHEKKTNDLFYYNHTNKFHYRIWRFNLLSDCELSDFRFRINRTGFDKMRGGVIFDNNSTLETFLKFGTYFETPFDIELDSAARIDGVFEGSGYKGFWGQINNFAFYDSSRTMFVLGEFPFHYEAMYILHKSTKGIVFIIAIAEDTININALKNFSFYSDSVRLRPVAEVDGL